MKIAHSLSLNHLFTGSQGMLMSVEDITNKMRYCSDHVVRVVGSGDVGLDISSARLLRTYTLCPPHYFIVFEKGRIIIVG